MKAVGIDIGTTTICGVVIDTETKELLKVKTLENASKLVPLENYEKLQDGAIILKICLRLLDELLTDYSDISSVGITGQMHGIIYVDENGDAVSPLITWQDKRGNLEYQKENVTYAEYLTEQTGRLMATGYGGTTHFYNQVNKRIPKKAVTFCTIPDYIAMKILGLKTPVLHKSMAASLGFYRLKEQCFDKKLIDNLGMDEKFFPKILDEEKPIGYINRKIAVYPALGDNQASYLGSVFSGDELLVNVGTGSQISLMSKYLGYEKELEYRPYIGNTYLVTGASLCGGYAYDLMKKFLEKTVEHFEIKMPNCLNVTSIYEMMNEMAESVYGNANRVIFDTRLNGTRWEKELKGSIKNITEENFLPEYFILATLEGICEELYEYYRKFPDSEKKSQIMIGSGNGIRKNKLLQRIFEDIFGMKLVISPYSEEAAYGVALYSAGERFWKKD